MASTTEIKDILSEILEDTENLSLIEKVAPLFIEHNLRTELIELYRLDFYYNSNPAAFEAIGDLYYSDSNYEEALNNYMSCAELSGNYAQIFIKLADVFGKMNDTTSQHACLEQARVIGGADE